MRDTKLDPGTLRALIDEARTNRDKWMFGICRFWWNEFVDWLQSKLDAQKEPSAGPSNALAGATGTIPTNEVLTLPPSHPPAPRIPPDLAEALKD